MQTVAFKLLLDVKRKDGHPPSTASIPVHPVDGVHNPRVALCHTFSWKLMQGEVILIVEGDIRPSLKDLGSGYATFFFGI